MFGISEETLNRLCEPREISCDTNAPRYPDKDILDVCLDGIDLLENDEQAKNQFRRVVCGDSEL